jgi:glycosyltransferase involved in cell wall biosynthesis
MKPNLWQIAYFGPLPPMRSGVADYSYELLPYLARLADITLFVADLQMPNPLAERFTIHPMERYPLIRQDYDIAIYQMGNSEYHQGIYSMLLRYPGIVVLHEYFLHHLAAHTIGQGSYARYAQETGYALGLHGLEIAHQVRSGVRQPGFFEIPLNDRLLDSSLGIIVHSKYMQQRVRARCHGLPVAVIPQIMECAPGISALEEIPSTMLSRHDLGCPDDALIFATAGRVTKAKRVTLALEAFARLQDEFPNGWYAVVGEEPGCDVNLTDWIAQHGLQDRVTWTGYVPDQHHFISWIAAADILVNLRYPTVGETSRTALQGLATGRPVIVFDDGWYAELPDDVCIKVPPNDIDALTSAMRMLAGDKELRQRIGRRAAEYARSHHNPERAAEMYIDFAKDVITNIVHRPAG